MELWMFLTPVMRAQGCLECADERCDLMSLTPFVGTGACDASFMKMGLYAVTLTMQCLIFMERIARNAGLPKGPWKCVWRKTSAT